MTTDGEAAVLAYEKEQKVMKKLKKLQKKMAGGGSDEDKAQAAKLEKKLAKLRKQLKSAQQPAGTETAASTESDDSAVAIPTEPQRKGKKNKKRDREAAGVYAVAAAVYVEHMCILSKLPMPIRYFHT